MSSPYVPYSIANFTGKEGRSSTPIPSIKTKKPRATGSATSSPYIGSSTLGAESHSSPNPGATVQWSTPLATEGGPPTPSPQSTAVEPSYTADTPAPASALPKLEAMLNLPSTSYTPAASRSGSVAPVASGSKAPIGASGITGDWDGEGEDDMLPDMADDDYSAQLKFQSQSKDNLKVLMDNFSAEQYDRYEAYRRNALPKQAVRRVIQQVLGHQASAPVAQVVAGVGKVFVGEIIEKARQVQQHRGETGPLSPDHLREAYRMYQEENGRVGAARPNRGKRMFVR